MANGTKQGGGANSKRAAELARKRGNQSAHQARLKQAAVMSGYETIGKLASAIRNGEVVVSRADGRDSDALVLVRAAAILGCTPEYLDGLRDLFA